MIDLADVLSVPDFTPEERARIDKVYRELRAKYDPIVKGGFRYRKPPPDFYRDAADKERHAEFMAGTNRNKR